MSFTVLLVENNADDACLFERAFQRVEPDGLLVVKTSVTDAQDYLAGRGAYADRNTHPLPQYIVINNSLALKHDSFLQWLRDHPLCGIIPTLVLSGSTDPKDARTGYQLGAHTYFQKTSNFDDWEQMLRSIFDYWDRATIPSHVENKCDKTP
jgi:two-component system, response regulator